MKSNKILSAIAASALMACSFSAISANAAANYKMYMKGDLNGDKIIDSADLKLMKSLYSNSHVANLKLYHSADVDWDGKITFTDVNLLSRYVNGDKGTIHTGDVNGDKVVDSLDVTYVNTAVSFSVNPKNKFAGDINGNGKLDTSDLNRLKYYVNIIK